MVLISAVQQNNPVIHTCILFYILFHNDLLQHMSIVPCAMQKGLVVYPLCIK